jgi:hypothetical protein
MDVLKSEYRPTLCMKLQTSTPNLSREPAPPSVHSSLMKAPRISRAELHFRKADGLALPTHLKDICHHQTWSTPCGVEVNEHWHI